MTLLVIIIALALIFDYINGFHDAANSIATIVSTKVLTPFQAVLWAAFFNVVAFFIFKDHNVANTIAKTVHADAISLTVILAGLIAAPMVQFAGLLQALPRDFAYGLAALIEKQGGAPEVTETPADEPAVEEAAAPAAEAEADAPAGDDTTESPEAVADAAAESNDAAPADAEGDTQES